MKALLISKYGEPSDKWPEQVWSNDLYKDNPEDWGMAICVGHLVYQSRWVTPKSVIVLNLEGDNFKTELEILYFSKKKFEKLYEEIEEENKDKL